MFNQELSLDASTLNHRLEITTPRPPFWRSHCFILQMNAYKLRKTTWGYKIRSQNWYCGRDCSSRRGNKALNVSAETIKPGSCFLWERGKMEEAVQQTHLLACFLASNLCFIFDEGEKGKKYIYPPTVTKRGELIVALLLQTILITSKSTLFKK